MSQTETDGPTGALAIFAILIMVLIAVFAAWRAGMFGSTQGRMDEPSTFSQ
jgi:cytochrome b